MISFSGPLGACALLFHQDVEACGIYEQSAFTSHEFREV
jgi:hypothetical protein